MTHGLPVTPERIAALPTQPLLHGDESPTKEGPMKSWLWTFVEVEGAEPTVNAAERSLSHAGETVQKQCKFKKV